MKLVIDVETTGLPQTKGFMNYYPPSDLDKYAPARIIQIAWIIVGKKDIAKKRKYLIEPLGQWTMTPKSQEIHGIAPSVVKELGQRINEVLEEIDRDAKKCDKLLAYGLSFDKNIILSEAIRSNIQMPNFSKLKECCVLQYYKSFSGCYDPLSLLYKEVTGKDLTDAHDAFSDVIACATVYLYIESVNKVNNLQTVA